MKSQFLLSIGVLSLMSLRIASPASFIQNSSFESNYNDTFPHYSGVDSWTGGSGVNDTTADAGGPFQDNGVTPDRDRVAFVQGSSSLSQDISGLNPGKQYWIQFFYNARNCCGGKIDVTTEFGTNILDKIANVKPVGSTNAFNFRNVAFTPDTDSGTLAFNTTANG